jgi:hypothetical protein
VAAYGVAPLAGSAMSLLDPVRPNVATGFRSGPTKGTLPSFVTKLRSDWGYCLIAFTKEGSANFRDFAPLLYLAFGIAGLTYS